jgi:hypothetical protein
MGQRAQLLAIATSVENAACGLSCSRQMRKPRKVADVARSPRLRRACGIRERSRRYCVSPWKPLTTRPDGGVSRVAKGADCKSAG